jgi:hypothetical protein
VSFFEPLPPPPPPPEPEHRWAPPIWDRASEGTLPVILPVGEIVHRGDVVAIEVECLRVYPNGFTIDLVALMNPRLDPMSANQLIVGGPGLDMGSRLPRVGIRFADGRTAGREADLYGIPADVPKDDDGIPTEPVLRFMGSGGGSGAYHVRVWVFPLPPEGPVEIHVALPGSDVPESTVVLDGGLVRSAAERAQVIWD